MSSRSMLPTLDRVCVERSEHELKTTKESRYCKLFLAKKESDVWTKSKNCLVSWRNRRPGKSPHGNEIVESFRG